MMATDTLQVWAEGESIASHWPLRARADLTTVSLNACPVRSPLDHMQCGYASGLIECCCLSCCAETLVDFAFT
jgi:hypothetical protein